jgi:hypothetical protein
VKINIQVKIIKLENHKMANLETVATLEAKTVVELRGICKARGIAGMTKKRKDIIIKAILADNKANQADTGKAATASSCVTKEAPVKSGATPVPGPVTAVSFGMKSILTKPNGRQGDKTTTTVQVSCGANTAEFPVIGKTVGAVQEFLKEVLNIDRIAEGQVNGKASVAGYILKEGDVLEFIKPAGRKG